MAWTAGDLGQQHGAGIPRIVGLNPGDKTGDGHKLKGVAQECTGLCPGSGGSSGGEAKACPSTGPLHLRRARLSSCPMQGAAWQQRFCGWEGMSPMQAHRPSAGAPEAGAVEATPGPLKCLALQTPRLPSVSFFSNNTITLNMMWGHPRSSSAFLFNSSQDPFPGVSHFEADPRIRLTVCLKASPRVQPLPWLLTCLA